MASNPLTMEEREEIRAGIERDDPTALIGDVLGRDPSTIYEELRRNGGRENYVATRAQQRADQQRCRPKVAKLVADPELARQVACRLEAKDSPMRISIELAAQGRHVSHECIYQAIYSGSRGLEQGLHQGLHLKRSRRRKRGQTKQKSHSLGDFNPISSRPAIANERIEFGHLEGDLIVGAYNRSALITVFDRMSRYLWLSNVAAKTADATFEAMLKLLSRIPAQLRHTLAWDQGAEMARWIELALRRNIDIYIADPKSPWQRPTNENGNAIVRRYVGKSTNLSIYTNRDLRTIEHRINTIPRRSLNWTTAHHIYTGALAMTS